MIAVDINTFAVTSGDSENPILKTIGLGPCVAVVLFDPNTKIVGLVHMNQGKSGWEKPNQDIKNMLDVMGRNGVIYSDRAGIQAHVVGGYDDFELPAHAKERLAQFGIENIVTDLRSPLGKSLSIAVDAKSGSLNSLIDIKKVESSKKSRLVGLMALARGEEPALVASDARGMK